MSKSRTTIPFKNFSDTTIPDDQVSMERLILILFKSSIH